MQRETALDASPERSHARNQSSEQYDCRVVETFKNHEDDGKYYSDHSMEVRSSTHTEPLFLIRLLLLPQSADFEAYPMPITFGVDRQLNITDKSRVFRCTPTSPYGRQARGLPTFGSWWRRIPSYHFRGGCQRIHQRPIRQAPGTGRGLGGAVVRSVQTIRTALVVIARVFSCEES